jgi:hypothetical protein
VSVDRLEQLLHQTDRAAAAPAPARAADLVDGVLIQSHRRKVRSRITGTVAAIFLCLGVTAWLLNAPIANHSSRPELTATAPPNIADLRTELASVQREVATREAAVDRLAAFERRSHVQERWAELNRDSASPDDPAADRAAFAVLYQADRLARSAGSPESVAQTYRQIIACFPTTPSAELAKQRLSRIQKEG